MVLTTADVPVLSSGAQTWLPALLLLFGQGKAWVVDYSTDKIALLFVMQVTV